MRLLSILLLALLFTPSAYSDTIYVPDDHASIQSAIDAANDLDVIVVRPGTYMENIDYLGKSIHIQSESGPEVTVIDGSDQASVVIFQNGEVNAVLEGFTITNGWGTPGYSGRTGGGIRCTAESIPIIRNNIITDNRARYGGGIFTEWAMEIQNNIISNNHANSGGGAIYAANAGSVNIENNVITDNNANNAGGGIGTYRGVYGYVRNNVIANNTSGSGGGGGIHMTLEGAMVFENNLIYGNETTNRGGGIYVVSYSDALIVNNSLCDNMANTGGGAIAVRNNASAQVLNSILWNNDSTNNGNEIDITSFQQPSLCEIRGSDVQGGIDATAVELNCTLVWGEGMIDEDPLFVSSETSCTHQGMESFFLDLLAPVTIQGRTKFAEPYHLTRRSPCINRGITSGASTTDFDGQARPYMGSVDMGADEFYDSHPLETTRFEVLETGDSLDFYLDARPENAGRKYLLVAGLSGTTPGFEMPGGTAMLPVNLDDFTWFTLLPLMNTPLFQNFAGTLSADGTATCTQASGALPPGCAGTHIYYAFCLDWPWEFVSNPLSLEVVTR